MDSAAPPASNYRRSTSPTLPSAKSLFRRSPAASADCRPLPKLHPLPPRSPPTPTFGDGGDTPLLVFLHPTGASAPGCALTSPRSVAVAGTDEELTGKTLDRAMAGKRRVRDFDEQRTSSDDGNTPRDRKRSGSTCHRRKPTYLVRKEEKDELTGQIEKLEAQLEFLKHTASVRPESVGRAVMRRTDHQFFEQEMHNHLLREAVRNQHFQLLTAQSALSELTYSIQQNQCPINTFIHLGCDIQQRRSVLENMKVQKLRDAKQLMEKRVQFLRDPAELRRETAQFPTDSGALCSVVFDVTPLDCGTEPGEMLQAYNAASTYVKRMGTMMPPYTGDDAGVVHGRLQVDTSPEQPTESSFVVFSELQTPKTEAARSESADNEERHNEPLGLLVIDSVDEDELHPYRPSEFLREDVNAVVTISKGSRRVHEGSEAEERVPCLVLTRWILLTLRPNEKGVAPTAAMDFLLQTCIRMGGEMLQVISEATPATNVVTAGAAHPPRKLPSSPGSSTSPVNIPS